MHRILTFFLGLYWLVQFALLAIAAAGGDANPLNGGENGLLPGADGTAAMAFMIASGLVAVLFLWLLATIILCDEAADGEVDDVARLAFAAATGVLTLCLAAGAGDPATAFTPAIPLHLAALLASYVAVRLERSGVWPAAAPSADPAAAARAMALGAAHNVTLSRFSGRPNPGGSR